MTSTKRPTIPLLCLLAMLAAAGSPPAIAAPAHRHAAKAKAQPDVVGDFRALAQQNPWTCEAPASAGADKSWPGAEASCAWQNRLQIRRWTWRDGAAPSCLSSQARWWHWAQAGLQPTAPRSVWDRRWSAQTLHLSVGGEERLLILQRDGKDGWQAAEWRWNPNPRPATRRWQEGRWKLLLEAASQPQFRSTATDSAGAARMQPIWPRLLGARPGELGSQGLALESAGVCLQAGNPLPGQPKLHLSYSPNDSRLEQRAAMHLQLSRQYPDAKWLTQFKMLDMPANLPSGAKFLASWVEGGQVIGQLWMPSKDDATTVRIRVTTPLPPHQGDGTAAAGKIKPVIERELEAIAMQWAAAYE